MRAGAYIETAAAYAGIDKVTLYAWMKKGRDKDGKVRRNEYGKFLNAVDKAFADCTMRDLSVIDQSAMGTSKVEMLDDKPIGIKVLPMIDLDGKPIKDHNGNLKYVEPLPLNWKAAAWRLERKMPREWGRLDRVEQGQPGAHDPENIVILPAKEKLPPEDRDPDVPDGD